MAHTTAAIYLRSTLLVLLMTVVVAAGCDSPKSAPSPQHSGGKHPGTQQAGAALPEFNPDTITQPFAVIKDVPIESADVASIGDDALVLGVIVNEQARAYPVSALETPQREIVNDQLGEAAIAATWWGLCFNGIVYDRKVDGQVLDFVVSGKLWRRSLVMQDLQTKSLWSHLLGTCMEGSLQGKQLKQIPSVLTSWQSWRDAHPQTTVIALSPVVDYTNDMLNRPDELVLGLQLQGMAKAWTFVQLTRQPAIQDEFAGRPILVFYDRQVFSAAIFDRRLAGQTLTFGPPPSGQTHQLVDESTGSTWDMHNGLAIDGPLEGQRLQALPATVSYFHAWDQFHPNSEYWQAPN